MDPIWTLDGDETSWATWASQMGSAPLSPLTLDLISTQPGSGEAWALDLGCGTGRAFQPLTQAGYRVIGLDPTFDALYLSQKRIRQFNLEAHPMQASAAQIPLPSASISFVYAISCLFHLSPPELSTALQEIERILLPDGKAILHFLDLEDWRRNLAAEIRPEQAPVPSYRAVVTCFCSPKTIRSWVAAAGLTLLDLDLRTSSTTAGKTRNWFAWCMK